ncbi:hypothetical protein ABZ517_05700 [Streptomyces scabiei]|uniref:hypothetical protein n=1 Tax=Streptomyces scabiei TaxID=1930 RepID=UPI0033F75888
MTITVVVMEPCCEKSAPDYEPPPRPYYVRGPWSPTACGHIPKRIPTITVHETRESADPEYAKTIGWHALPGYLYEGEFPPEGERFRIMRVAGSLSTDRGYFHAQPGRLVFPTAELATEYAEKRRISLYNIVGDTDTVVRLSSYGMQVGRELIAGEQT